eukprot:12899952-Prorocentrum_lima.AAC.1
MVGCFPFRRGGDVEPAPCILHWRKEAPPLTCGGRQPTGQSGGEVQVWAEVLLPLPHDRSRESGP